MNPSDIIKYLDETATQEEKDFLNSPEGKKKYEEFKTLWDERNLNMLNYVSLIAKPNTYYDEGTEVFNYEGKRYTIKEWEECIKHGACGTRGYYKGELDGEWSFCDEFDVIKNIEFKELKDA